MTKASNSNPFGEGFEEAKSGEFIKWEKVGDKVKGILTDVSEQASQIDGKMQKIYTLQLEDGTEVRVGGRRSIDQDMKRIVIGQWVGLLYKEDVPSKKKGNNPFKLVKVYPGQIDENFKMASAFGGEVVDDKEIPPFA